MTRQLTIAAGLFALAFLGMGAFTGAACLYKDLRFAHAARLYTERHSAAPARPAVKPPPPPAEVK